MPPVCDFFLQGNCRYGANCRNEHPNQGASRNRFAPLQPVNNNLQHLNSYTRSGTGNQSSSQKSNLYDLNASAIHADLTTERPVWLLSAYGPGRAPPVQLFGGPLREQSPEEIHLRYYEALAAGNIQPAVQYTEHLLRNAEQQMKGTLADIEGAIKYINEGAKEPGNRLETVANSAPKKTTNAFLRPGPSDQLPPDRNVFGGYIKPEHQALSDQLPPNRTVFGGFIKPENQVKTTGGFGQQTGGAFGQPSQPSSTFGAPTQPSSTFGSPAQLGTSGAFGQPSVLGQTPNPFGAASQPSSGAFGQQPTSFGAASQPASGAFGQPSALGQNSSSFGTPSLPVASGFSQSSTLGQQSSPFGTPSQPASSGGFGQPSALGQAPNPFGQKAQSSTPFGAPNNSTTSKPFGASSPAQSNPFGSGNASSTLTNSFLAQNVTTASPFGSSVAQTNVPNPFGNTQPANGTPQNPARNQFVGQSQNTNSQLSHSTGTTSPTEKVPYAPGAKLQHPPLSSYCMIVNKQLQAFKEEQVSYKNRVPGVLGADGTWKRIWNPDGPPAYYAETELKDTTISPEIEAAYLSMRETGIFRDGVMPITPPKREWCTWDF